MISINQKVWQPIKSILLVVIIGPLLIGLLYIVIGVTSLVNTRTLAIETALEVQADFNGHYPATLEGYKDWKAEDSHYGYTTTKQIDSFITDSLMYTPLNNGKSFELSFTYMVDIYRFGPVDGTIQER